MPSNFLPGEFLYQQNEFLITLAALGAVHYRNRNWLSPWTRGQGRA